MTTTATPEQATAEQTAEAPPAATQDVALARYDPDHGALVVPTNIPNLTLTFERGQETLTAEQMHMLAPLGIEADWDPAQVAVFLLQCHRRRLDPWRKQAYLLVIDGKYVHHTGIHGLLAKAQDTGRYRGIVGPQWCGPDGVWRDMWLDKTTPPTGAQVGILAEGFAGPVWGRALFDEFAPMTDEWINDPSGRRKEDGRAYRVRTGRRRPAANWRPPGEGGKPSLMLAKVAKALALRDAFPEECGGFFLAEETEKSRTDERARAEQRAGTDDVEAGAARRRAAFDAAMEQTAQAGPFPMFAGHGVPDDKARLLLLDELDEQATILGKTRREATARWVASMGGTPIEDWALPALARAVRSLRLYVLKALREQGDEAVADRYMQAPDIGTVEELFGRTGSTIDGAATETVPADKTGERA